MEDVEEIEDRQYHRMKNANIPGLVISLGIPTIITALITNIYNMVDTYYVGTLGTSQQGAIGIVFTLQFLIQAIAFTLGHGSGIYVSKHLALKENDIASRYVSTAFFTALFSGIFILIFGLIFLTPLMYALGSTDTILPYARDYSMCVLSSGPLFIASMVLNNNLRYEGRASLAMVGLVAGALLNIFGDHMFVKILDMGVLGAGLSTAISQSVSFFILLFMFLTKATSKLSIRRMSKSIKDYLLIIRAGFPSFIRNAFMSLSSGVLNQYARLIGEKEALELGLSEAYSADSNISAMSIASRYGSFISCIGMGLGQGFQPVASFNYAINRYDRVKKAMLFTLVCAMCMVFLVSLLGIISPRVVAEWFNDDNYVISIASKAVRYVSVFAFVVPITVIGNMLYQSIRKAEIASFLAMLRSGVVLVPIILIFYYAGFGFRGIALATPISDVISAIITLPFLLYFLLKKPKNEIINEEKKKI